MRLKEYPRDHVAVVSVGLTPKRSTGGGCSLRGVGPACRRSLRATAVGIESEQAVPEVDIGEAAKTCKREVAK